MTLSGFQWVERAFWSRHAMNDDGLPDEPFRDDAEAYGQMDAPDWLLCGSMEAGYWDEGTVWPTIVPR